MASNLKYAATLKNAKLNQITSQIGTSGLLSIYSGTQPTNPDTALSGNTLLAQLALSATFAPGASSGVRGSRMTHVLETDCSHHKKLAFGGEKERVT